MRLAPQNGLVGSLVTFGASEDYTTVGGGTSGYTGIIPGTVIQVAPTMDTTATTAGLSDWIGGEVMAVLYTGSAAVGVGRLMHLTRSAGLTDVPNTANTGRPVVVTLTSFSAGDTTPQFGWVMTKGITPVQFTGTVTTGALYIGGAGIATSTAAAGKQILSASCLITNTVFARQVNTKNGSFAITMNSQQGLFPGIGVTGTGIPGSTTVASLDPDGITVYLSAAATATGSVSASFSATGFGTCIINAAFVQGQIT